MLRNECRYVIDMISSKENKLFINVHLFFQLLYLGYYETPTLGLSLPVPDISREGEVSQIFGLGPRFYFMVRGGGRATEHFHISFFFICFLFNCLFLKDRQHRSGAFFQYLLAKRCIFMNIFSANTAPLIIIALKSMKFSRHVYDQLTTHNQNGKL